MAPLFVPDIALANQEKFQGRWKGNDITMSKFYDKLTESFDTADSFVLGPFTDMMVENTCTENGIMWKQPNIA